MVAGDLTEALKDGAKEQGKRAEEMLVTPDRVALESLAQLADEGRLTVHVDEVFPIDQITDAHRRQESGRVKGKLAIVH